MRRGQSWRGGHSWSWGVTQLSRGVVTVLGGVPQLGRVTHWGVTHTTRVGPLLGEMLEHPRGGGCN